MKLIAMVLVAATSCVSEFHPARAPKPDNAFAAATRVLVDDGETIEMKDEAAGVIVTKWDEDSHNDSDFQQHYRWKVTIGADVLVESQCQNKDNHVLTHHDWQNCEKQANGRSEKAADLAKKISETHIAGEAK